jgi:uncharacterized protein YqeY
MLTKLKQVSLAARKTRDPLSLLLTTLLAEATRVGKDENRDSTDVEVTATIRKFIKNAEETVRLLEAASTQKPDALATAKTELALLQTLLPAQASGADLDAAIADIVGSLPDRGIKQMGAVMAKLNEQFSGNLDKAAASAKIKAALA